MGQGMLFGSGMWQVFDVGSYMYNCGLRLESDINWRSSLCFKSLVRLRNKRSGRCDLRCVAICFCHAPHWAVRPLTKGV